MTDKIMYIFDCIMFILGIYLLQASFVMKRTGVIPLTFISPEEMKKCRDTEGLSHFLFPRSIAFAIICLVCGLISFLSDTGHLPPFLPASGITGTVMLVIFLIGYALFTASVRQGKGAYFQK